MITHPEKVLFPEEGSEAEITKGELVSCLRKCLVLYSPHWYAPPHAEKTSSQTDRVD